MTLVQELTAKGLMTPPDFVLNQTVYETKMGSQAYGCSEGDSDLDVYAFCMPPLGNVFPHLRGEFPGFGQNEKPFEVFQQHHMQDGDKEYDVSVYSVIKYFQLCMECNPNMVDSLFTRDEDVLTQSNVSRLVRANRTLFLSKQANARYLGYAKSQVAKMKVKTKHENEKRDADIKKHGYSLKEGYHLVRLAEEASMMLNEGDMDLKRHADLLKYVRAGGYTLAQLEQYLVDAEKRLLEAFETTKLPETPNYPALRDLLLQCFEEYYGKLDFFVRK